MLSDYASIHSAPNSKDLGKKKRTNRNAKLKQCKLDARREQWLSQGKNKVCKEKEKEAGVQPVQTPNGKNFSLEELEVRQRGGSGMNESKHDYHHDSDSESPSNSPNSVLNRNDLNYTGRSSSSGGYCSGSVTEEEEEGDEGCLDDWEAMADALAADDHQKAPCSDPPVDCEHVAVEGNENTLGLVDSKPRTGKMVPKAQGSTQAWRPDDAFRPQSLPNLSKQFSFPSSKWHCRGGIVWANSAPSSCPICYEDLDLTDTSFLPCLCGFRLCLFCHKRILEGDGRCPGCRKPYDRNPVEATVNGGSLTFQMARSRSMITRS